MSRAYPAIFIRVLCRLARRKKLLLLIACVVGILDQRRRSRAAARRYEFLYNHWSKSGKTVNFLHKLHATLKALLAKHEPTQLHMKLDVPKVDLAIAGGGAKVLYAAGAYIVLQHAGIRVDRVSGASAGAYLGALLVGDRYHLDDLLEENLLGWGDCVVQVIQEHKTLLLGKVWEFMSAELTKRLNGWLPQPGKLFISVTTFARSGLVENIATRFHSAQDLERTICASMSVPFILCDGPFNSWRGGYAIDGGFKNNCPVSVFCGTPDTDVSDASGRVKATMGNHGTQISSRQKNLIIIKVDCNRIATMPTWRRLLHVVYAPGEVCGNLILEGAQDMLEILSSGKKQISGITLIESHRAMIKREFSYQLFPGKEHISRLLVGRNAF